MVSMYDSHGSECLLCIQLHPAYRSYVHIAARHTDAISHDSSCVQATRLKEGRKEERRRSQSGPSQHGEPQIDLAAIVSSPCMQDGLIR